jgi:transposase
MKWSPHVWSPVERIRRDFPPSGNGVDAPRLEMCESINLRPDVERGSPMSEVIRELICRVGVDLAKRVIQVHAVAPSGRVLLTKAMTPEKFFAWCASLPAGCIVASESCSGAHHVARRLRLLGLDARILAAHHVAPYRVAGKRSKNDANDAAAICEAASRPHLHCVPVKSAEQQGRLAIHRLREGYKEERTGLINRIRGLLAEFGQIAAQSPDKLREQLGEVLEDASNEIPGVTRLALQRAQLHWINLELEMAWCEERIAEHVRSDPQAKAAAQLLGVGPPSSTPNLRFRRISVTDVNQINDLGTMF